MELLVLLCALRGTTYVVDSMVDVNMWPCPMMGGIPSFGGSDFCGQLMVPSWIARWVCFSGRVCLEGFHVLCCSIMDMKCQAFGNINEPG